MIEIDGSFGEGGGQVLRTSLSLSCVLKKPFRIFNIRKNRRQPGLRPQHLMCVQALKEITRAKVQGDKKGSTEIVFEPSDVRPGDYFFDIGTAGSTTMLLQALLPPLVFSSHLPSKVVLKGGTHAPFCPTFHYIDEVFIPILKRMGIEIQADIETCGFYPRGGGKIRVDVSCLREIKEMDILNRGEIKKITGISVVGNLPLSIAERQRDAAYRLLLSQGLSPDIEIKEMPTPGEGTFIFLKVVAENTVAGFSSLGERGKRAEVVGEEAARELIDYYLSDACLDPHLADQIVLYLALAGRDYTLTTSRVTNHLVTNLWVISRFVDIRYKIDGKIGSKGLIKISPFKN